MSSDYLLSAKPAVERILLKVEDIEKLLQEEFINIDFDFDDLVEGRLQPTDHNKR